MQKIEHKKTLLAKRNRNGLYFSAHWIVGMLLFFVFPLFSSIVYSFSDVSLENSGLKIAFQGLKHYKYLLTEDAQYVDALRDSVSSILISLPIVVALSLVLALVLNDKFRGRLFFRAIFFLPVILANSVVMDILKGSLIQMPLFTATSGEELNYGSMIDFNAMLSNLNMPDAITDLFSNYLSNIFNLIWSCGVPTILFLSGLQSISPQLYEVGKIEGANRWELLWMMEIPMLRNIITLVLIYSMIDLFTAIDSPVMILVTSAMFERQLYDRSSAMLWGYFLIVGVVMGIVLLVYNRFCVKKWE